MDRPALAERREEGAGLVRIAGDERPRHREAGGCGEGELVRACGRGLVRGRRVHEGRRSAARKPMTASPVWRTAKPAWAGPSPGAAVNGRGRRHQTGGHLVRADPRRPPIRSSGDAGVQAVPRHHPPAHRQVREVEDRRGPPCRARASRTSGACSSPAWVMARITARLPGRARRSPSPTERRPRRRGRRGPRRRLRHRRQQPRRAAGTAAPVGSYHASRWFRTLRTFLPPRRGRASIARSARRRMPDGRTWPPFTERRCSNVQSRARRTRASRRSGRSRLARARFARSRLTSRRAAASSPRAWWARAAMRAERR